MGSTCTVSPLCSKGSPFQAVSITSSASSRTLPRRFHSLPSAAYSTGR